MSELKAALLLCHIRHAQLGKTLKVLEDFGIERVYISIDGPRNRGDQVLQERIFEDIESASNKFSKMSFKCNTYNQGVGVAVITALNWFFEKEDCGVIIEDDLEFEVDFLKFAEESLKVFRDDKEVWMVSGSRLIPDEQKYSKLDGRILVSNYPIIWGWASWANRWKDMLSGISELPLQKLPLSIRVKHFWKVGHRRVSRGLIDTWDIPLAAAMRYQGKRAIFPPINLVRNLGFDEFASHDMKVGFPMDLKIQKLSNKELFSDDSKKIFINQKVPQVEIDEVNIILEDEVFKIKLRHSLIWLYSVFFDFIKAARSAPIPLITRLNLANQHFQPNERANYHDR